MSEISAAVILNGGKSSRMGTDKSQLVIEGKTLLERAIELLAPICEQLYISGHVPQNNLPTLPDFAKDIGPMGGIMGALESLTHHDRILFIPVDMPFLTQDTLRKLITSSIAFPSVLVDMRGAPIPVVAVFSQESGKVFRDFIQSGNYGLQMALRKMKYNAVMASDARECMNINTPEDFRLISEL